MQFSRYVFGFISQMRTKTLFYPQLTGKTHAVSFCLSFYIWTLAGLFLYVKWEESPWPSVLSYVFSYFWSGGHLLSHTVSSAVSSAVRVLTIVFGMGTGVSPGRIATRSYEFFENSAVKHNSFPTSSVLVGLIQPHSNMQNIAYLSPTPF